MAKKKIVFQRQPRLLSHFTTTSGLIGMIENREIWCSNVSYMNDRRELVHGIEMAEQVLKEREAELFPGPRLANKPQLLGEVISSLKKVKLPDTYATCFCRREDLLSQWRAYGGRVQGVSVTFRREELSEIFRAYRGVLMEVIYDGEVATERLVGSIDKAIENDGNLFPSSDAELAEALRARIVRLVPRLKHEGFKEEDEWRYVIQSDRSLTDLTFRDRDGIIVPYIRVKAGQLLPIEKITVGPGKNQDLAISSIAAYLNQAGYREVPVKPSSVPYRQ